jgi:hypothetical protein
VGQLHKFRVEVLMSTFDIMRKSDFSSLELPTVQSEVVRIKIYHLGRGKWELEKYRPKTKKDSHLFLTKKIKEDQARTILKSYDRRNEP